MTLSINTAVNNPVSVFNTDQLHPSSSGVSSAKAIHSMDSKLVNMITQGLSRQAENKTTQVEMHTAVRTPEFMQLLNDTQNSLQNSLDVSGDADVVTVALPKSSGQANLMCMLIVLANEASIADIELSSAFGIMSEDSSMNAAQAQQAQGLASLSKSIVASTINLASNGTATHGAVKNYTATKANINQNLKGMHLADKNIRDMQNALNASKNDHLDLSDIAASSTQAKKGDGSVIDIRGQQRELSQEHHAVASRNLDELLQNRDSFNAAFMKGEARTRLTSSQIEAKRAIGTAGSSVADGAGSMAQSVEQKEETEERSETKVMDGAVEMSRQQAQKSQQLLSNVMSLLNDIRRSDADLASTFANNIKA